MNSTISSPLCKNYVIISDINSILLACKVRDLMENGWKPLGGPFVVDFLWHQAMVLYDE